jgi:hypothetical protein
MSTQVWNLGDEVDYKDGKWRVVRFIVSDHTLFEDADGVYIITESYLMLKSPDGVIDFMVLSSERVSYTGMASSIKGVDPLLWRKS